jgi:O-antigen ligase
VDTAAFWGLAGCVSLVLVSVAASQILLGFIILVSFHALLSDKGALDPVKPVLVPLGLFCAWTVLTALMASDVGMALTGIKKFYLLLLVPVVPLITRGEERISWIFKAIFTVALLSSLIGIFQYVTDPHKSDLLDRITGSMSTWMTYSGLLMLALIPLFSFLLRAGPKKFLVWFPVAALIALAIILSLTRNAVLGVYAGVLVILILAIFLERRKRFLLVFVSVLLFPVIIYLAAPSSMQQRFRSALDLKDPNTVNRIVLYKTAVRMIQDNPWFGVGPKNVKSEALKYRDENEFPKYLYQHMHNNALHIAVATGIPGFLLWLWFMLRLAWDSLGTYRYARSGSFPHGEKSRKEAVFVSSAALGCWAALMVAGMFEYNFGDSEVLTLFLFIVSAPYTYSPTLSRPG